MLEDPQEMMAAYFTGVLDTAGSDRLADWISESRANARSFARFALEHHALEHLLRIEKYGDLAVLTQQEFLVADDADQELAERTDLQLLSEMEDSIPVVPVVLPDHAKGMHSNDRKGAWFNASVHKRAIVIPRTLWWGGIAALLLLGLWISWQLVPQAAPNNSTVVLEKAPVPEKRPVPAPSAFVVATLEGQSDSAWADGESRVVGDQLTNGAFALSEGAVRLRFNNNALVLIESPARFSLDHGSMITLDEGRLVSHCDEQAHGFRVRTPYADFIDVGTEFGVLVSPWKEAQLHVFQGKVHAVVSNARSAQADASQIVHTSQAVAIGPVHSQAIQPITNADPELFDTVRRRVVANINTGASMSEDGADHRWLVKKLNQHLIEPHLPAVLFVPPTKDDLIKGPVSSLPEPIFLPNRSGELCWIKPNPSLTQQDIATTTYTTSFSLEGYDASSAMLDLGFNADNFVSTIRLNGQSIPIPQALHSPDQSPYAVLNRVKIQEAFLPGHNQIEIVVTNAKPKARPTYTGLVAELSITAQPDWIAATEEGQIPN